MSDKHHAKSADKAKSSSKRAASSLKPEDGEFLCVPQFQNTLPSVPSGPFFKADPQARIPQYFSKFSGFKVSSLDKSFVWQPHFGIDLGMKIDLVDQDAVLVPSDQQLSASNAEIKYLTGATEKNRSKVRGANLSEEKPWWLRNTVYLESNLYSKSVGGNQPSDHRAVKRLKVSGDIFSDEFIEASFDACASTEEELLIEMQKSGKALMWSLEIRPDTLQVEPFSLVRFDESLQQIVEKRNKMDGCDRGFLESALVNYRSVGNEASGTHAISLAVARRVQQQQQRISEDWNEESDDLLQNNADEGHGGSPDKVGSSQDHWSRSQVFDLVGDFKMEIKGASADQFLLKLDESTHAATYVPVRANVDLRKLVQEENTKALPASNSSSDLLAGIDTGLSSQIQDDYEGL